MSDSAVIETRSRSRSKTPGLLSNENGDAKGAKKVPTVSLIEEEENVIESSSQPSQRPKRQRRSAKNAQSDTSGDTQLETVVSNSKQSKSTVTASTTTTTTTIVKTSKQTINGSEEKNEESTSSLKTTTHTASNNDAAEIPESQSIFNNIFNAIKTSTPILTTKRTKRTAHESSSPMGNVDFNLHPAYKEYKEAGEYWNKFPKTDYTYSELSPHRRELGAGIVAMPNMSRKSLDKYQNRIEAMIQQNPTEESFIRRKFLSNMSYQKKAADLQYDSADEVDVSDLYNNLSARRNSQKNVFHRFIMFIIGVFSSSYSSLKRRFTYGSKQHLSYTPIKRHNYQQQGFLRSAYNFAQRFVLLCISKVYLFVSTILCLDTWLLYTRSENVQQNHKRKRFLIGLLVFLPLMLFGGTYIYLDPPQNISFPQISLPQFPKIAFPSITIPKISFDFIKWPEFSYPSWPEWLTMPKISFPSISMPQLSFDFIKFSWPKFSWPLWLKFPEFNFSWPLWLRLPSFSFYLPDLSFNWPEISFAWLKMPEISFALPVWLKWPEFNFSMPSISFDFLNPIINYTGDVFGSLKSTSIEFLDKIRGVTMSLLNEFQIVWNENFNIK